MFVYLINILGNKKSKNHDYPEVEYQQKTELKDETVLHNGYDLQLDKHLQGNITDKENAGEGRLMASYFFPFFPQFYDVDYNDVWNFLKNPDTIGYFLFESFLDVCSII